MNNWAENIVSNKSSKVAIIDDYGKITYQHLSTYVVSYASHLKDKGLGPGDRILITSGNHADTIIAVLASAYIGATVCMLSPDLPREKISQLLVKVNAKYHIKNNIIRYRELTDDPGAYDYPEDAEGFMLSTSGTTGFQKFIVHRHSVFFDYFNLIKDIHAVTPDSVIFCGPKLHWGYGFTINLIAGLGKGSTIVLTDKIRKPLDFCDMLNQEKVTHVFTVPVFVELLVRIEPVTRQKEIMRSIKYFFTAGDILPKRIFEKFYEYYGKRLNNGWGQTEVLSYATINHASEDVNLDYRSVGRPINGVEIKTENGEMYVKSPCQAIGYLDDLESTNYTFKENWVRTNDMIEIIDGHVMFLNRKGNLFKIRGEFCSIDDVEQTILNTGLVYECLVSPVTTNGELSLLIEIVGDNVNESDLRLALAKFKVEKNIKIVDSLPKTYTNKKLRIRPYVT